MIKRHYEAFLLKLAALIIDRNVKRSAVTSRKDNNWLFEARFELNAIAKRISTGYNNG
jgi:hypothetical protein